MADGSDLGGTPEERERRERVVREAFDRGDIFRDARRRAAEDGYRGGIGRAIDIQPPGGMGPDPRPGDDPGRGPERAHLLRGTTGARFYIGEPPSGGWSEVGELLGDATRSNWADGGAPVPLRGLRQVGFSVIVSGTELLGLQRAILRWGPWRTAVESVRQARRELRGGRPVRPVLRVGWRALGELAPGVGRAARVARRNLGPVVFAWWIVAEVGRPVVAAAGGWASERIDRYGSPVVEALVPPVLHGAGEFAGWLHRFRYARQQHRAGPFPAAFPLAPAPGPSAWARLVARLAQVPWGRGPAAHGDHDPEDRPESAGRG